MTDKERLEHIKTKGFGKMKYLHKDDRWLIEQAEQLEIVKEISRNFEQAALNYAEENRKLCEALKFYADKNNYNNSHDQYLDELPSEIDFDEGSKAREVLEGFNNGMVRIN